MAAVVEAEKSNGAGGSNIWILAFGAYGDHTPFSALAAGLERAGHRVKCFGLRCFERAFTNYGLDVEPINWPVALHRRNTEARDLLRRGAEAAGLEGPGEEEEHFLHLMLLKIELFTRKIVRLLGQIQNGPQLQKLLFELFQRFDDLLVFGGRKPEGCHEFLMEQEKQCIQWHASEESMDLEACKAHRRQRLKLFCEHLREYAARQRWSPFDLLEVATFEALQNLVNVAVATYPSASDREKAVHAEASCILKFLGDADPSDVWSEWAERWLAMFGVSMLLKSFPHLSYIMMQNVFRTMEDTPLDQRPQMCVFMIHTTSVGLALQAKYGVRAVMGHLGRMQLHKGDHMSSYARFTLEESEEGVPCTPLRSVSPIAYSQFMTGGRQLCSISPTRLADEDLPYHIRQDEDLTEFYRSRWTGEWLHEASKRGSDDAKHFHSPEEREKVMSFLNASNQSPICMSFGSSAYPKGIRPFARLVVKTLMIVEHRCIFLAGMSGITERMIQQVVEEEEKNPTKQKQIVDRILWLSYAPHDWLLPRCILSVQHGGSGTTSEALRTGVPSLVVPFGWDQGPNAGWIKKLGVGMETSKVEDITFGELGNKMRSMLNDQGMRAKAREVAKVIRAEQGVTKAVEWIESFLREEGGDELVDPPGTKPPFAWLDGPWANYDPSGRKLVDFTISGSKVLIHGGQVSWMRTGSFLMESKQGLRGAETTYNVEVYTPGLGYSCAAVHDGGTLMNLADGSYYRFLGAVDVEANRKATAAISAWIGWVVRAD